MKNYYKHLVLDLRDAEKDSELDCEIHNLRPLLHLAASAIEELTVDTWHNAKTDPPKEDGEYLVIKKPLGYYSNYRFIEKRSYANNLSKVDKHTFCGRARPGWYYIDDEYGYIDVTEQVIAWDYLPAIPDWAKAEGEKE